MTRIEQRWPNPMWWVETVGVGMPRGFSTYAQGYAEVQRQAAMHHSTICIIGSDVPYKTGTTRVRKP
jgi:hypothetical protein